jgi:N-acetyl-alpha-D-muramate 1-phosphate uridylyltransferase
MQVVILAGGRGTRLRPVTGDLPKSLAPVAGRPFIEHQFELLAASGIRHVVLCTGFGSRILEEHVGDGSFWDLEVSYSRDLPERPLGTGGAIVQALPLLEEHFLVLYGDSYLRVDYSAVAAEFLSRHVPAMMCVYRNRGKWDRSNVRVRGNRVVHFRKDTPLGEANWIDYGLSAFHRRVFELLPRDHLPLDLASVQSALVDRGEMSAYRVTRRFFEIGRPEGLQKLERYLTSGSGAV